MTRTVDVPTCCSVCQDDCLKNVPNAWTMVTFITCSECGNKRCPKASAHWQECTGSNDPGQVGSFDGPEEHWPCSPQAKDPT